MSAHEKTTSKEEELNKDEFRQLIPHLECNQLFLIQIQCSEKWQYLFDAHYENKALTKLTCTACSEDLDLKEFDKHIYSATHLGALEKVDNFYHPLFTSEKKNSLSEENSDTAQNITDRHIEEANSITAKIELLKRKQSHKSNSSSFEVALPLEELMTVKFQNKEGSKWRSLLTTSGKPDMRSKFICVLCSSKVCKGIKSLNQHLKGALHQYFQSKVHEVRVPKHDHLTKNCLFSGNPDQNHGSKFCNLKEESDTKIEDKNCKKKEDDEKKESTLSSKRNPSEEKKKELLPLNKESKNGLIGVEYVAQLESDSQPGSYLYACCLCDSEIMTSAQMMENHLISFEHRRAYCELYYLDTIENFKRMILDCRAQHSKVMPYVLEKIAQGIDEYHGYGTPHCTTESHFKKAKKEVAEKVRGFPHACQEFGPSFSNAVTAQEIRDFKKSPLQEEPEIKPEGTTVRFTVRNPKKYYLNMRFHVSRPIKKKRVETSEMDRSSKTASVRREKRREKRSLSRSHEYPERKRKAISNKESYGTTDIWSVYRDQISKAAVELESLYVNYRKQPEKHPLYDQEWNTFWRRRKEELMLEGRNYRSYDFQPEWTSYFRQRLEQMFGEDLQKSNLNVRHRLNIPINAEEDSLITPQYKSETLAYRIPQNYSENIWHKTVIPHHPEDHLQSAPIPKKDEKPTVIHMLRLMTALEDHLGNLGTKVLELLTKAVSLEKFYAADSPELEKQILTSSNYKLLKTAAEKLKSKLYADLIEGNKVNSFKRVIDCSETILKKAEMMGWANEREPTIDNESTQIKKLIEVLQEKKGSPSINEKSLSDALMDVISQKKLKEPSNSFKSSVQQTQMEKQSTSFMNNIPSNYYSGMPTQSLSYNQRNMGAGPVNRNSGSARGRGRNSFGNVNMQWSNGNPRYNFPANNHGPNPGFINTHPNGSNNGYWRS